MKESQLKDALREVAIPRVLEEIPENIEQHEFSEEYKRKKAELLRECGITDGAKKTRRPIYRAASVILVVVLMFTLMTVSVKAFFPEIWRVFVSWFEDYASVSFDGKHDDTSPVLEELMEPSYVPEGLEVERLPVYDDTYAIEYFINSKAVIQFTQEPSRDASVYIDNSYEVEDIRISNHNGWLGSQETDRIIVWDDGKYRFRMTFSVNNISEDEVILMANSVKSKQ